MNSKLLLTASIVLGCGAIFALVHTYSNQTSTEKRLQEMERRISQNQSSTAPASAGSHAPATAPSVPETTIILDQKENYLTDFVKKKQDTEKVMQAGWNLINERRPELAARAAEQFQLALERIDDQSPDLYNGLGRALLVAGKPKEAIEAWQKGLSIEPRIVDMQSGIGWAYWNLKDYYHAREAWLKATSVNPKSIDAWSGLAWVELALKNYESSKAGFAMLVDTNPRHTPWIMGLSMARAHNYEPTEINKFFPLPEDLTLFNKPADK